jgi:hypothetical protein
MMKGASSSLEELHGKPAPVPDFAGKFPHIGLGQDVVLPKNWICIVDLNFRPRHIQVFHHNGIHTGHAKSGGIKLLFDPCGLLSLGCHHGPPVDNEGRQKG